MNPELNLIKLIKTIEIKREKEGEIYSSVKSRTHESRVPYAIINLMAHEWKVLKITC